MRFRENSNFEREIKASSEYRDGMAKLAELVAAVVRAEAPVATGKYRDSVKTRGNVIYTDDPFGHLVEWGSINNSAYAPIRRGARAAGLRLTEASK